MSIRFAREVVGELSAAEKREWLVTNGLGGYGSATIAGSLSRGYHGLLVAATTPPAGRRLLLVKLEESVGYGGASFELGSNRWQSGWNSPQGHRLIESFELQRSVPCWRYACADALIDKRVWMEHGQNTTYVSYTVVAAKTSVTLSARAVVNNRVFHNTGELAVPIQVEVAGAQAGVSWAGEKRPSLYLKLSSGSVVAASDVYRDFYLPEEEARGLRAIDSHVHAATLQATLSEGETIVVAASTETDCAPELESLGRLRKREEELLETWRRQQGVEPVPQHRTAAARCPEVESSPLEPPGSLTSEEQLVLAADQFVVARPTPNQPSGATVIAGYHWFGDWGRDTMVALPGLTLSTGRASVAEPILLTFAKYVSRGMLPNRFPRDGEEPEYNTIDATFWYFQAIEQYYSATGNKKLLQELFPTLREIVEVHVAGTRYGIGVDPEDGLIRGGEPGVQLTWMDAKVGNDVITPRIGKPIEVNALWYAGLLAMERFALAIGEESASYAALAARARTGFGRFWNEETGYCWDVLDGPNGPEGALRPNQLIAVSLASCPLSKDQQRKVVDACAFALRTSNGVRSLTPDSPDFQGHYHGDQRRRDSAYHQGTVWAWLLGPFIAAHLRVYKDPGAARRYVLPLQDNLREAGMGTLSEIFEGDAPFASRGCIAQAWSVGEALRILALLRRTKGNN